MTGFFDALLGTMLFPITTITAITTITTSPVSDDASFVTAADAPSPTPEVEKASQASPPLLEDDSMVLRFLRDRTRLFEVVPDLRDRISGTHTLLKGFVQSGKSRLAHALLVYLTMECGHNVCMLLRDYTGDYTQFRYLGGLEPFLEEMVAFARAANGMWTEEEEDTPPIYYLGDVGMSPEGVSLALAQGGAIVIGLANPHQMRKVNAVWDLVVAEGNDTTLSVVIDDSCIPRETSFRLCSTRSSETAGEPTVASMASAPRSWTTFTIDGSRRRACMS